MDRLKSIKETLMGCVQGQMGHLDTVDTKELGDVIDMIKDLEEAIYYHTITDAMKEQDKQPKEHHHYYTERRYMPDRMYYDEYGRGRMYYDDYAMGGNGGSNSSGSGNGSSRGYQDSRVRYNEFDYPAEIRDVREGRSPMRRRYYMEGKEKHLDKTAQMKELEKYMHELSSDITEMIQGATPEETTLLKQKLNMLADKIK